MGTLFVTPDPDENINTANHECQFPAQHRTVSSLGGNDQPATEGTCASGFRLPHEPAPLRINQGGRCPGVKRNSFGPQEGYEQASPVRYDPILIEKEKTPGISKSNGDNLESETTGEFKHELNTICDPQVPSVRLKRQAQIQQIMLAQRAMKQDILRKRKAGAAAISEGNVAKIKRPNPDFSSLEEEITTLNPNTSSHEEGDHSWMNADNNGVTDEQDTLQNQMDTLAKVIEIGGELSDDQKLQYLHAAQRLKTASRRLHKGKLFSKQDEQVSDKGIDPLGIEDEAENDFEVSARHPSYISQNGQKLVTEVNQNLSLQTKEPRKESKKRVIKKTARDIHNSRRDRETEKMLKRTTEAEAFGKKGRATGKSKHKKQETSPNAAELVATTYRRRMKNKLSEFDDTVEKMLRSLVSTDFIQDRMDQGNVEQGPDIVTKNKAIQLKELLSSIPRDYNTNKARNEKNDLHRASKAFGHGKVKSIDGKWLLAGMKTPLYHHQLLAADWMVERELSLEPPNGGLLADAMGLGKTVSTLATMVGNPPAPEDIKVSRKATLIVVPASLLSQWEAEIREHVDEAVFRKVISYKASARISTNILSDCDIVLTSYTEVMHSCPFPTTAEEKAEAKNLGADEWYNNRHSERGDLQRIKWYRIVLDEAQITKNFKSRTSVACHRLDSTFRWTLSGTPILNNLNELYPYFRFLRMKWANDYLTFKKYFGDPDAIDATQRLNVMLSVIMMRRTTRTKILGRPLVHLPQIHPTLKLVTLSGEERAIYRTLEDRFRGMINNHFKSGDTGKNYAVYLAQLLRLRQAVSHPFLLERCIKDVFNSEDLVALKNRFRLLKKDKRPIYEQIEQWVSISAASEPNQSSDRVPFGRSNFGKDFKFDGYLNAMDQEKLYSRLICILCSDLPAEDAVKTDCGHIFCGTCLEGHMHAQAAKDESDHTTCPKCEKIFSTYEPYRHLNLGFGDGNDGCEGGSSMSSHRGRPTTRRRGAIFKPAFKDSEWLKMCINGEQGLLPSAKAIAVKAQVLKWVHDAPDDKILIFTQFRMMTRIVGLICEQERWGHVYFMGDMDMRQRTIAVEKFHSDKETKIMIAVLKCGGVGLNLKCANRCINIDPWWNHSVEQQAFGRIFRIGQTKETHVTRFVAKNTVDMRILDMQQEKIKAIEEALQDTGKSANPLTIEEMASLFGHLVKGDDGITQVVPDYDPEEDDEEDEDDEQVDEEDAGLGGCES